MTKKSRLVKIASDKQDDKTFLRKVSDRYDVRHLSELLEKGIGAELSDCFILEKKNKSSNLNKYLLLTNTLLPNLPHTIDEDSKVTSIRKENGGPIEKFIANIIKPLFGLMEDAKKINNQLLYKVYFKMLFFGDIRILLNLLDQNHILMITKELFSICLNENIIFSKAIKIITERLPEFSKTQLLTYDTAFQLKRLTFASKLAGDFFQEHNLENIIKEQLWKYCVKIDYENGDLESALMTLSKIFEEENALTTSELIYVGVVEQLYDFIQNSFQSKNDKNIKLFLTKFICIRENDIDKNRIKSKILKNLVKCLTAVINDMCAEFNNCYHSACLINLNELNEYIISKLDMTADLLQYLYLISKNWYQWFNLFNAPPLLDDEDFICTQLIPYFDGNKNENEFTNYSTRFIEKCLVMVPFKVRRDSFKKVLSRQIFDTENLEVTRNMSLSEIALLFGAMKTKNEQIKYGFKFHDEFASGDGPTKEFYFIAGEEYQKYNYHLWLGEPCNVDSNDVAYVRGDNGLFPKESSNPEYESQFFTLGKLFANAARGKCLPSNIPLNVAFFRQFLPGPHHELYKKFFDIPNILPKMSNFIRRLLTVKRQIDEIESDDLITDEQKEDLKGKLKFDDECSFEDLCIFFIVPGSDKELIRDGANIMLTQFNLDEYLDNLARVLIEEGSLTAVEKFRKGFNDVIPFTELRMFLPEELKLLFCGKECRPWSVNYLMSCCDYSEGYTKDSTPVQYLFEVMSKFTSVQQRQFLLFVTSMPTIPAGGLRELVPRLTITKNNELSDNEDKRLPIAFSCNNHLFLPHYSDLEIVREKILLAITEGTGSFGFA